jgi:hypothetical protein
MADATTTPAPTAAVATSPAPDATDAPTDEGKGSKSAVLADLAKERDQRQALEQTVQQLQTAQKAQTEALAKAFGLKPEETSDVQALASQVTALQEQFATTTHQNTVLNIANEHGITSKEDIALLTSVKDEATMRSLAARIKTSDGTPGTPKPDLTQGGKDAPVTGGPAQDFASFLTKQLNG